MIDKEIKGRFETRNPTNEKIREYKRHGSKLIDGEKLMYTHAYIIMNLIMHYRVSTPEAIEFKTRLGFNAHDLIMTKEQSILTKIMKVFASEEILLQHYVLSYKSNLYFRKETLAIEIDEKGHNDRNINYEIKRQKEIEKNLIVKLLELILMENILMYMLKLARHIVTLLNQLKIN